MHTAKFATAAVAVLFAGWCASGIPAIAEPTPEPPAPPPAPKTAIDADGTYAVNVDLAPGTYASAGPVGDGACYWKRADGTGATLDNAITKKPQVVAITPTDASFKTTGCQTWQLTDQAPPNQLPPQMAGLKMQGYLALINGMAAMGPKEPPPSAPAPDPAASAPGPAPGPAPDPAPVPLGPAPGSGLGPAPGPATP